MPIKMSFDETKPFDSSEYDSMSLTESLDGSPVRRIKKKKKIGLFRSKNQKEEKRLEYFERDSDSQLNSSPIDNQVASINMEEHKIEDLNQNGVVETYTSEHVTLTATAGSHDTIRKEGTLHKKPTVEMATTHKLHVKLLSGENLASRDSNGLSDPYVKFKIGSRTAYKSKCCKENLNPRWDEEFEMSIHVKSAVSIRVFDRDRATRDDFMGGGNIDLSRLSDSFEDVTIHLSEPGSTEELGYIHLQLRLIMKNNNQKEVITSQTEVDAADEKLPQHVPTLERIKPVQPTKPIHSSSLKRKTGAPASRGQAPVAAATIQLVSGTEIPARDTNGLSDPYVKLCVGKNKRKSKVCYKTLSPVWKEEFSFYLTSQDTSIMEVTVWDKDSYRRDDFIGRCELDLWSLDREITHSLSLTLTDTPGNVLFLVTIHDIEPDERYLTSYDLSVLRLKYSLGSTFNDLPDVGFAEIRIVSASGLRSADINGKSDPFCVVQLCNARAQTQTCYKTLDPVWNRVFTFPIHDIHDVFDIWIFDQDQNSEKEFLGRVAIPILRSHNGDEKIYVLKDRKLKDKSKGTITVQISYIFNPVRAAIRTFTPREEKFMEETAKFKKALLLQNFSRVWRFVQNIISAAEFVNSCFTWQNRARSALAFLMFLLIVWNFELYMLPVALLMLLMKNYVDIFVRGTRQPRHLLHADEAQRASADDDDEDDESSNKPSLIQRLRAIEEVLTKVQAILDIIASLGERVYNTLTWSVPFLSWLIVAVLCVLYVILYFVSIRTIVLLWGINKFTKRLRKPNFVPNNEVLDYLSRIPSNVQLDEFREFPTEQYSPHSSKKRR